MKTVVVISDTHGNLTRLEGLKTVFGECDYILHLGDTSGDGARIKSAYGDKTILINGNCDPVKLGENERVITVEGVRIFATHGHLYSAKTTLNRLYMRGNEENCRLVLYGHTHCAREDEIDGITLINPGNLARYSKNSYCYLVINGDKFVSKIVVI